MTKKKTTAKDLAEAEFIKTIQNFRKKLVRQGWKPIGAGRHRVTFHKENSNVVIKVPVLRYSKKWMCRFTPTPKDANIQEALLYRNNRNGPDPRTGAIYAPCRLLSNGCLMMRYVKPLNYHSPVYQAARWIKNLWDGDQVGRDKNGIVMAYDYASELNRDLF